MRARLPFWSLSHRHFQRFVFLLLEHPSAAMAVVTAPLPCNEAVWSALHRNPGHEFGSVFDASFLWSWHNCLPRVICLESWGNCIRLGVNAKCIDEWSSEDLKFAVTPSSEGGVDICIDSHIYHVRKHLSVHHPVVQMVLFATSCDPSMGVFGKDQCVFRCQKSMVPKELHDIAKNSLSSPITKQEPQLYTKREAWRDGGVSFVQGSRDFIGVPSGADNHETAHGSRTEDENSRTEDENNKILKPNKTYNGGSGSEPEDIIMQQGHQQQQQQQQQRQQLVGSLATGVNLWPSEVAPPRDSFINEDCLIFGLGVTLLGSLTSTTILGNMMCNNGNEFKKSASRMPCVNEKRFLKDPYQARQQATTAPVINSTEQKGEPQHHSTTGSSVKKAQDSFNAPLKNTPAVPATKWIVASAAPHHATGNRALLSDFSPEHGDIFLLGGDAGAMPMQVVGHGVVVTETMVLPDVWYVPGLAANLVSVSQLAELDYSAAFGRGKCYVRSPTDGAIVGMAHGGEDGLFALDFLRVPLGL